MQPPLVQKSETESAFPKIVAQPMAASILPAQDVAFGATVKHVVAAWARPVWQVGRAARAQIARLGQRRGPIDAKANQLV